MYETGLMFGDARYVMRHAGFLFRLPPAQIAMPRIFIAGIVVLVAGFFWARARSEAEDGRHPAVTELPRANTVDARTIEARAMNGRR